MWMEEGCRRDAGQSEAVWMEEGCRRETGWREEGQVSLFGGSSLGLQ